MLRLCYNFRRLKALPFAGAKALLEGWKFNAQKTGKVQKARGVPHGILLLDPKGENLKMKKLMMVAVAAAAMMSAQAETKYWTGANGSSANDDGNWTGGKPGDGDDVILDSGSANMTWDINDVTLGSWTQDGYTGTVTFKTGKQNGAPTSGNNSVAVKGVLAEDGVTRVLKVTGGCKVATGKWTCQAQVSYGSSVAALTTREGTYQLIAEVGGDMTIGASAVLDVNSKGFLSGQGTSGGSANRNVGGAHGGYPAYTSKDNPSNTPPYGSFRNPVTIGSGGGLYASSAGGGAIRLTVGGALTLAEGCLLDARGQYNSVNYNAAGGSVSITARSISGGGTITADFGLDTIPKNAGSGGGGGRISIILTGQGTDFSDLTATVSAKGGCGYDMSATGGTIYYETKADGEYGGRLVIDGMCNRNGTVPESAPSRNFDLATYVTDGGDLTSIKEFVLRDHAIFGVKPGQTVDVSRVSVEGLAGADNRLCALGGTLIAPSDEPWTNAITVIARQPTVIKAGANGTGAVVIGDGRTFICDTATTVLGSLTVADGGVLTHTSGGAYRIDLSVTGDVVVEDGGRISQVGGAVKGSGDRVGGVYGGLAQNATGHCYGSLTKPISVGGDANGPWGLTKGGGAVKISTPRSIRIEGSVEMNGGDAAEASGSGGSVWLTSATLSGEGRIAANGGNLTQSGAARSTGSGGRIALWLTDPAADFSTFTGKITACAGTGATIGGGGTIYLKTGAQGESEGTLIIDNGGLASSYATEIYNAPDATKYVSDAAVGNVIIRNGGFLKMNGQTLEVCGVLSNETKKAGLLDVRFVGADKVSRISGTNDFCNFVCDTPGKTNLFAAGSLTRMVADGNFTIAGEHGKPVALLGESEAPWELSVDPAAHPAVDYAEVAWSDARGGQKLVAYSSEDRDHNENWTFFAEIEPNTPIAWTGASNAEWGDAGNWDLGRPPLATDKVTIPATERGPVLRGDPLTLNWLKVETGATLELGGVDLTVTNRLAVAGALVCNGRETITCPGDVDFTGGSFTRALSTFVLNGNLAESVNFGTVTLHDLVVVKSGGSVAFAGGFAADNAFTFALDGNAGWSASFANGKYSCRSVYIDGVADGQAKITLSGTAWSMEAKSFAKVFGVRVAGCTASGVPIAAMAPSVDNGVNFRWTFNVPAATWTGADGDGDFANTNNWAGLRVPDENTVAIIDSAETTITVSAPCAIGGLQLGGGETEVKMLVRAPLDITGDFGIYAHGEVALDAPCTVGGFMVVDADGVLTHTAGGSYRIDLTVAGDVTVVENGRIDLDGRGYSKTSGPGGAVAYGGGSGSYGGLGANYTYGGAINKAPPCYGSYFWPTNCGSGGWYYADELSGGGAVKIVSGGKVLVDGVITANSVRSATLGDGSGGSILISCTALEGRGSLTANVLGTNQSGGGGRIAIHQRAVEGRGSFAGTVEAYGCASCGTVYYGGKGAGTSGGEVLLRNGKPMQNARTGTELPVAGPGGDRVKDFRATTFTLDNNSQLALTADITVKELEIPAANGKIYLNGHTLTILSRKHRDERGWPENAVVKDGGQIIWRGGGMAIIVR